MRKHWLIFLLFCPCSVFAQFVVNTGISLNNSAPVILNGDWDNQNASFVNNGMITLSGNWNSTGGYSPSGTGGFTLNNIVTQQFSHNHQSVGVLIKNGVGDTQVDNVLTVNSNLDLQVGLLVMTGLNSDTLVIMPNASVNANSSSYIVGKVTHLGTGDLFFPVSRAANYLPLTIHNVTGANPRVTISVEDTPGGYSIVGPGNVLIGFPYLWRSNVTGADTATYIEVQYPATLAPTTAPIVTRSISSNQFQSMARQSHSSQGGRINVESYFRGLRGLFSVAEGASLVQDSLALVNFYDSTSGAGWKTKANWLVGPISTWVGVTITNNRVTGLSLPDNGLTGSVPPIFIDLQELTTVNLSTNTIKSLPDLTSIPGLATLDVSSNALDFASLIANVAISGINYPKQAHLGDSIDVKVDYGTNYDVGIFTQGVGNVYQWTRNGSPVTGATDSTFLIASINRQNMGTYYCEVTNPAVPGLTLTSRGKRVRAVANLSGKFVLPDSTRITSAEMLLFKINPVGAYDTLANQPISADGTFLIDKVVLDDYELFAKPDTIAFPTALPSYYKSTIFWEVADTLVVNGNRGGLNITAVTRPTPPKGNGSISGTLEEGSSSTGGREKAKKRVAGAGVSASRAEGSGRTQAKKYILVAYTETDTNGEFLIEHLLPNSYRLNIQYPGYPMDTTSFIDFTIGSLPSNKQVIVDAAVIGNKIVVTLLKITGLDEGDNRFSIYPNPARLVLNIDLNEPMKDVEFGVSTIAGQEIMKGKLNESGSNRIDVSTLSAGIYAVDLIRQGKVIKSFRIVLE